MTSISTVVSYNLKEIEQIKAAMVKCELDFKFQVSNYEKKVAELKVNIEKIQKHNDELLALREQGFNSEEEYIAVKQAELKLKEFNERKANMKCTAIKNLETLIMYNTGAFRRMSSEPKKDYIKRCEEFLGRSEALTISIDPTTFATHAGITKSKTQLWIYRDIDFEEMKRVLQETDKNIPVICEITTKYLKYVEECILAAHRKHNQALYSKIVSNKRLNTYLNTNIKVPNNNDVKVPKRWCPECIGTRYEREHETFVPCKPGDCRYSGRKFIPSEKDGRPCILKRTIQFDGCLIALPCLRRYKIKLHNDVLTSMSLDATHFRFDLEQDGYYDQFTNSDSNSDSD